MAEQADKLEKVEEVDEVEGVEEAPQRPSSFTGRTGLVTALTKTGLNNLSTSRLAAISSSKLINTSKRQRKPFDPHNDDNYSNDSSLLDSNTDVEPDSEPEKDLEKAGEEKKTRFDVPPDESDQSFVPKKNTPAVDDSKQAGGDKKIRFSIMQDESDMSFVPKKTRFSVIPDDSDRSFVPKQTRFSIAQEDSDRSFVPKKTRFSLAQEDSDRSFVPKKTRFDVDDPGPKKIRFAPESPEASDRFSVAKQTRFVFPGEEDLSDRDQSRESTKRSVMYKGKPLLHSFVEEMERFEENDHDEDDKEERTAIERLVDIVQDWLATFIVGFLVVAYWRGYWMLIDGIFTCDPGIGILFEESSVCWFTNWDQDKRRNSGYISYAVGMVIGGCGVAMMWKGIWVPSWTMISKRKAATRFAILWLLSTGTVCVWRGIWYLTDFYFTFFFLDADVEAEKRSATYWGAAVSALCAYFLLGGSSLVASPAIFLMDGPSRLPPPIAITALASYYSLTTKAGTKPPEPPHYICYIDIVVSFFILPILVIIFWRCTWLLQELYLWPPEDNLLYIAYAFTTAIICYVVANDDVLNLWPNPSSGMVHILRRGRSLVLAIGTIAYWRFVWYTCDLLGIEVWTQWLCYLVSMIGLLVLGCFSSVLAPPFTLGSDAAPAEDSADDPLFSSLPLSYETIFFFGIKREAPTETVAFKVAGSGRISRASTRCKNSVREGFDKHRAQKQSFFEAQRPGLDLRTEDVDYIFQRTRDRRKSTVAFRTR